MIFTVLFGYHQIVLVTFGLGMMAKASQHDATTSPDDQDDGKSMDLENQDADNFGTQSRYLSTILNSQKTEYNELPFIYQVDSTDTAEGVLKRKTGMSPLTIGNDHPSEEWVTESGMVKRLSGNFQQGSRKYKYDPALKLMGLGKRDKDRPKYNPGWKFIGLGKREHFEPEVDPSLVKMVELERRDYKLRTTDEFNPLLSLLALGNVRDFLAVMKGDIGRVSRKNYSEKTSISGHREHQGDIDSPTSQAAMKMVARPFDGDNNEEPNTSVFFTRSRKPTRIWKNKSRPIYDPGWVMTGLGK